MNFIKQHASGILLCLFEVLVGILLIADPVRFASGIIIAFGIVLLVIGLISTIRYFRMNALEAAASQSLVKGLLGLSAGAFCVFHPDWFIATFPLLTILFGAAVFIAGIMKLQWMADSLRLKTGRWFFPAVSAAISIISAVVILQNPFESTMILWMFTGVSLIVEAVFDVIALFFSSRSTIS